MQNNQNPRIRKLRPVLFVRDIAQGIGFWKDRLGFGTVFEFPNSSGPEFVVLNKDGVEIVIQRHASPREDASALEPTSVQSRIVLYVEVESLPEVLARAHGVEVVMPLRKTSYGAAEIAIREPGGHIVCFSQMNNPAVMNRP